jgi:hypothetical protein
MPPVSAPNPTASPYAGQGPDAAPAPYAGQGPNAAASPGADPYAAFANAPGASPYGAGGTPPPNPYVAGIANPYASYAAPVGGAGVTRTEIGGWLLFLCIALTILVPLQMLTYVVRIVNYFGGVHGPLMLGVFIDLGIAAYSIYAGLGLWTKRAKAVQQARVYFGVRAGIAVLRMLMVPGGLAMAMTDAGAGLAAGSGVIVTLASCGIGFAYLTQSVRVRETYGSNS